MLILTAAAVSAALITGLAPSPATAAGAPLPTRLSIYVNPRPTVVGDDVVVSGRLTHKTRIGKRWVGLGGRAVRLAIANGNGTEGLYLGTVVTNTVGVYSQTFRAPRTSGWRATYQPAFGDAARGSTARSGLIKLAYRTQITHYSAGPRVLALGSKFTIRGRVAKIGAFDSTPIPGAKIELYWASDGKSWKLQSAGRATRDGNFTFRPSVKKDGYWVTRLPATGELLAAETAITYVDGRHRSRIGTALRGQARCT